MKNNTWLDFFKKTLKVSGIILLILLIIIGYLIYRGATHDSKTYLECTNNESNAISYLAFNDYRMFMSWDELNEEFKHSYTIEEINKKYIKARAYASIDDNKKTLSLSNDSNKVEYVYKMIWQLDRETGLLEAYFENTTEEKVKDGRQCKKINKKDLPITKVDQKF
ncbi:hypothetical protein [Candidatus Pelagibacter sp. HIMB1746]|uniref:hypothetical protein n=1 Tax=unclassified Candidatus Pelagibacter TaxID=2647897 RepID=UPI003F8451A5